MKTSLFLEGRLRQRLSEEEKWALENASSGLVEWPARATVVERGELVSKSFYLVEGTMLRHLDDRRGERQIVGVNIAGDFVDLHGYAMKRLDHDVACLTHCVLAVFDHAELSALFERYPNLARAMWFSTLLDAAMHREWIFALGRLNAEGRVAHLVLELVERLTFVGMFDGSVLPVPLTQRDFAMACGITFVHANRVFRSLRQRGAIAIGKDGQLQILDAALLRQLADFDPTYLYGKGDLAFPDIGMN